MDWTKVAGAGGVGKSAERQFDQLHDPVSLAQDLDDLLVVANVVPAERAALAVLEPLLRGLIAADVEIPRGFRHAAEMLGGIDPDLAHPAATSLAFGSASLAPLPLAGGVGGGFKPRLFYHAVQPLGTFALERERRSANRGVFHQVQAAQRLAVLADRSKGEEV